MLSREKVHEVIDFAFSLGRELNMASPEAIFCLLLPPFCGQELWGNLRFESDRFEFDSWPLVTSCVALGKFLCLWELHL